MGKTELAANLFRVTQTEEKIRAERIRGQSALEGAAHDLGRKVRKTTGEHKFSASAGGDLAEIVRYYRDNCPLDQHQ